MKDAVAALLMLTILGTFAPSANAGDRASESGLAPHSKKKRLTDAEIRQILIDESIAVLWQLSVSAQHDVERTEVWAAERVRQTGRRVSASLPEGRVGRDGARLSRGESGMSSGCAS